MSTRAGSLLVAGTTSDAGKSVITAGLCRWLAREGVKVAPFKAQNMSLNSMVTPGGAEIGRAQIMQAAAAGIEPEAAMNPVLLKPGSDHRSQVLVLGEPVGEVSALSYRDLKGALMRTVLESLEDLRARFDVVICEGAGSPTEINLRATDIANMGLARAARLPVLVVGDIDRGGVFAAMFGTVALLDAADQELIAGFIINKFRGDPALLAPGVQMLERATGRPTLGVLPWSGGLGLDVEDSLGLPGAGEVRGIPGSALQDVLTVAVIRLPRISNFTDIDALSVEPGIEIRFVDRPEQVANADLVILPGTRATVADLAWLRAQGLDAALRARAAGGAAILGICGGYQMLAESIEDEVESRAGIVPALGLLPTSVRFGESKVRAHPVGEAYGEIVVGYEIHHGVTRIEALGPDDQLFLDGCRRSGVWGTTWHGILENDGFRRAFLSDVAQISGRAFRVAPDTSFREARQHRLDVLGDLVTAHLDTDAIRRLLEHGPPTGLPFLPPGAISDRPELST